MADWNNPSPSLFSGLSVSENYGSFGNLDFAGKPVRRKAASPDAFSKALKVHKTDSASPAQDLIVHECRTSRSLSNRWAFSSEMIDYDLVQDLRQPLQFDQLGLRRVKLCLADGVSELLTPLIRSCTLLQQIDIDVFRIDSSVGIRFRIVSLVTLSIGKFEMVPKKNQAPQKLVQFVTPALRNLYLGHDSIKYVNLSHPASIQHLITADPVESYGCSNLTVAYNLLDANNQMPFANLTRLELNDILEANFELIIAFATGAFGEQLRELHCNLRNFENASYQFRPDELSVLSSLWYKLKSKEVNIRRFGPTIYFRNVRLEFSNSDLDIFASSDFFAIRTGHLIKSGALSPCLQVTTCELSPHQKNPIRKRLSIYPNIRRVFLAPSPGEKRTVEIHEFLPFLRELASLTDLMLSQTELPPEFYSELVNSFGSDGRPIVSRLNQFAVCEKVWDGFGLRDFQLLASFSRLRYLRIELLSWLEILPVLRQTRHLPVFYFEFEFRSTSEGRESKWALFCRWIVRKIFMSQPAEEANRAISESAVYHTGLQYIDKETNEICKVASNPGGLNSFKELEDFLSSLDQPTNESD